MHRALALAVVALSACSGSSADLTCAVVADPTNCWARAATAAAACLPSRATPGTLSADRTKCTWSDGATVTFSAPLPTDQLSFHGIDFMITGAGCSAHFVDTAANRLELTAGGETDTASLTQGTYELACGGGTSYAGSFNDIITCPGLPTDGFEVKQASFTFTLVSVATPGALFTCNP